MNLLDEDWWILMVVLCVVMVLVAFLLDSTTQTEEFVNPCPEGYTYFVGVVNGTEIEFCIYNYSFDNEDNYCIQSNNNNVTE